MFVIHFACQYQLHTINNIVSIYNNAESIIDSYV